MKINWKLRLTNKATLVALISAIFLVISSTPLVELLPVWVNETLFQQILNIFVILGIIVDPTTAGITDSELAMTYEEPKQD